MTDYIPSFIAEAPWYLSHSAAKDDQETSIVKDSNIRKRKTDEDAIEDIQNENRLKHQRINPSGPIVPNNEPKRGTGIEDAFIEIQPTVTATDTQLSRKERDKLKRKAREWKKSGRCELCGGKHKKIDCLSTAKVLKRDDDGKNFDSSRDNWHGFDNDKDYSKVLDELKKKELATSKFQADDDSYQGRSLDEKPRYLEVIKSGEELRYNPKSRVYKDLKKGFLNERGQFIPNLTGEAAEFEKLKKFTRSIQEKEEQEEGAPNKVLTTEFNPTEAMLKLKEKEKNDQLIREQKQQQLFDKYG